MQGLSRLIFHSLAICFIPLSLWAQAPTVGVLSVETGVSDGYLLLSALDANSIYLIDNCGREIHAWKNSTYVPGAAVYLLEDGSLLKTCQVQSAHFSMGGLGGRIEKWSYTPLAEADRIAADLIRRKLI